ncbi:MAG: DUF4236 domain-containing protein [Thermoanaerobaculia bacterium]
MGFYLRKSLSLGPVRFNLSRSGVGTSVGIKGFRVGRSASGRSYVHAGAGGLYYRQNLSSPGASTQAARKSRSNYAALGIVLSVVCFLSGALFLTQGEAGGYICMGLPIVAGTIWLTVHILEQREAERAREAEDRRIQGWEDACDKLEKVEGEPASELLAGVRGLMNEHGLSFADVRSAATAAIIRQIGGAVGRGFDRDDIAQTFDTVCSAVGATFDVRPAVAIDVLKHCVWALVADLELSETEDAALTAVLNALKVNPSDIQAESRAVLQFRRLRAISAETLPIARVDVKLQRGEICHSVTTGSLLERRVVRSWVEYGERQTEEEYVKERSGDVYVTSKRILIVGDGTLSIPFDKILDVDLDCDAGRIIIAKDGRKTPYVLECDDPIFHGGLIAKAAEVSL